MKKQFNIYSTLFITVCAILITFNLVDRASECYNLGLGIYKDVSSSGWWFTKMFLWAFDLTLLLVAGIFFILLARNIDKSIIFEWKNVRLFRILGGILFFHFLFSSAVNYIETVVLEPKDIQGITLYTKSFIDFQALLASLFIQIMAEAFAVGLRLKEEQDLTI